MLELGFDFGNALSDVDPDIGTDIEKIVGLIWGLQSEQAMMRRILALVVD